MREECPGYAATSEPNLFVFADYSIWGLGYAMRLAAEDEEGTAVFLIGVGDRLLQIAPTFEEFLKRYAIRDRNMLFGEESNGTF